MLARKAKLTNDFIEPHPPELVDVSPHGDRWVHEIKFDGYRTKLHVVNGQVTIYTRRGYDWTNRYGGVAEAALGGVSDCIIDGEAAVLDPSGTTSFAALQSAFSSRKGSTIRLFAFDLLSVKGEDLRRQPLLKRKERLLQVISRCDDRIRYVEHYDMDGPTVKSQVCALDLEGIVSKLKTAPYARSGSWLKSICGNRDTFVIGGWRERWCRR